MSSRLKNPAELAQRLDLRRLQRLLLVDVPASLQEIVEHDRREVDPAIVVEGTAIRSIKHRFDGIVVWREGRVGSQSLFEALLKRLDADGIVWAIIPRRKVQGLPTPAAHRLSRPDLDKALGGAGLSCDREVRLSAWHEGFRFSRRPA